MPKATSDYSYRKIEVNELPKQLPDFKNSFESKDVLTERWLVNWLVSSLKAKKIQAYDLLPKKSQIADYLGISVGTVQNAIRYVEDKGFLASKQRIGTMVVDINSPSGSIKKLTSKREKIIIKVKQLIINRKIKLNHPVPSSRSIATILGASPNTTRLAYEYLCNIGVLESRLTRGNDANWILKQFPTITDSELSTADEINSDTLVNKVSNELKEYISKNLHTSSRLPAHYELSKILNVSIKTVHDAMKQLISEGILKARRGRYGTTVIKMPNSSNTLQPPKETSIFATAEEAAFYSYQKVEDHIVNIIRNDYEIGEKLPSMDDLSKKLDVSTNTVRKALQNLSKQNIVQFGRGRYGGTFVTDIPEGKQEEAFKWLSVNPRYVKVYSN